MKHKRICGWILLSAATLCISRAGAVADTLTDMELLGKFLFYQGVSTPGSMSCAVCHGPSVGFTGPDAEINKHGAVYKGAVPERFGNPAARGSGDRRLSQNSIRWLHPLTTTTPDGIRAMGQESRDSVFRLLHMPAQSMVNTVHKPRRTLH